MPQFALQGSRSTDPPSSPIPHLTSISTQQFGPDHESTEENEKTDSRFRSFTAMPPSMPRSPLFISVTTTFLLFARLSNLCRPNTQQRDANTIYPTNHRLPGRSLTSSSTARLHLVSCLKVVVPIAWGDLSPQHERNLETHPVIHLAMRVAGAAIDVPLPMATLTTQRNPAPRYGAAGSLHICVCASFTTVPGMRVVDTLGGGLRSKLGLRVIQALTGISEAVGCYKTILNCGDKNVPFYQKCGFEKKEYEMARYHNVAAVAAPTTVAVDRPVHTPRL